MNKVEMMGEKKINDTKKGGKIFTFVFSSSIDLFLIFLKFFSL